MVNHPGLQCVSGATAFAQGKIVVANDEYTLSDTGCVNAPEDADQMPPEPLDGASYSRLRGSLCLLLSASFKAGIQGTEVIVV
ncbi:MAG: hypothetical protein KatS3mg017_0562 [Fimbriimonadales bacterium]|nr:MAG: hypothetical protein KatS3mg017_0562 [Fimbriimonadales bacterium]